MKRIILFVVGSHRGEKLVVSGTRAREERGDANPFLFIRREYFIDCHGKTRDASSGRLSSSHTFVTRSNQIPRAEPHCGASVSINRASPWSAYGVSGIDCTNTRFINCLPLSVSLGSKLIYTVPHDHYNWLSRLYACQDLCRIGRPIPSRVRQSRFKMVPSIP